MTEDREYLPTSENLYSTEQKTTSNKFRDNWDLIEWEKDEDFTVDSKGYGCYKGHRIGIK